MNKPTIEVKVSGNQMTIVIEDLPPNLQDQLQPVIEETVKKLLNPNKGDIANDYVE